MPPSSYQYSRTLNRWQATDRQGRREWFNTEAEASVFCKTGNPMLKHMGFYINDRFQIFDAEYNHVFTAPWQRCDTIDEAKITIDASIMAGELMNKYPAPVVAAAVNDFEFENGHNEAEEAARKAEERGEQELVKDAQ